MKFLLAVKEKTSLFAELVKFEHTIFALPFAYLGLVIACKGLPDWHSFFYVTLAMVGARTAAMAFNRLVDRKIDALNPRTANRPIPSGRMNQQTALLIVVAGAILLVFSAWQLNQLALYLSPVALLLVLSYSYTKRFTSFCHLVLGICLAVAPAGGYIAGAGSLNLGIIILATGVALWVAGFDIIYATLDHDFDCSANIRSAVVSLGVNGGLRIAIWCHLAAVSLFALTGLEFDFGKIWSSGVVLTALLIFYEHRLAKNGNPKTINQAFFTVNAMVSVILLVVGVLQLEWKGF